MAGIPIESSSLEFKTREYYLSGSTDSSKGSTLTFEELDNTLIFLSNSIANVTPNIDTSSLLLTASATLNIIEFTKGDGITKFTVTIDTGSGQVYTAGDGININNNSISSKILTVNGQGPNESGNISTALTAVLTGTSSSLVNSSSGTVTGSITNGTVWVISGDGDPTKNGDTYIFKSGSIGQWYQISPLDEVASDARYVRLSSTSTQTITSSLLISGSTTFSGSLFWSGASNLGGAANSVLVLDANGQMYKTGSYGSGTTPTPAPLTFSTQNTNYALVPSDNNKVVRMNASFNLEVYITASLFTSGDQVIVFQSGSGQVTFIPDAATEMLSANNMRKLRTQYSAATLTFTGNTCYLFGDIAP